MRSQVSNNGCVLLTIVDGTTEVMVGMYINNIEFKDEASL